MSAAYTRMAHLSSTDAEEFVTQAAASGEFVAQRARNVI
jgi:hypothetical protein